MFRNLNIFRRNYSNILRLNNDLIEHIFHLQPNAIKWQNIREEILAKHRQTINTGNIDSLIINKCFTGIRLDIAQSYIAYLNESKIQIQDATILKLIELHYVNFRANPEKFSSQNEEEVLKMCKIIMEKYELMNVSTAEIIIHGLSITKSWREAEKYFEMLNPKSDYSCFISRAINEGMDDLAWKYLNTLIKTTTPKIYIFSDWFEKHKNDREKCEKMFEFIAENRLLLPETKLQLIANSLKSTYICTFVTINSKGKCPSCSGKLPGAKITKAEFDKIAKRFLDDIIIKSDVFQRSNPHEIERFKTFVNQTCPYDCVIDGLNVAFSCGNKLGKEIYAATLEKVVKHFVDKKQKVLVIGRRYMETWPNKYMKYIRANAKLFLADDLSHDDLFVLYAALRSGPQTNILSKDLMRQHTHLLGDQMRNIMRKWQQEHQYTIISSRQRVIVREPIPFEIKAHKVNFKWHLPFTSENIQHSSQTFELPTAWLCVREKLSREKEEKVEKSEL